VIRGNLLSFPSSILATPLDPQSRAKDDDEEEYEDDDDDENETLNRYKAWAKLSWPFEPCPRRPKGRKNSAQG
jgi:hypothetical protein